MLCAATVDKVVSMKKMSIKTYSELIQYPTFEDRFKYLQLKGRVGEDTFGFDRYINQRFYRSKEWQRIRDQVILRDKGCDLGIYGRELYERIIIHHMNPISVEDIRDATDYLLDPEYLVCASHLTHNAIHYADESILVAGPIERRKNDTCPWRHD